MAVTARRVARVALGLGVVGVVSVSLAQTPAQMEYERQQREYWRAQEQKQQEQQRQQQQMQDNARKQQQDSAAAAQRSQEQAKKFNDDLNTNMNASQARQQEALKQGQAQGAKLEEARQSWLRKPPLAAQGNPLLGRWTRPASSRASSSSDPFAGLAALAKGGLCEALFGDGVFEFRPATLVGIDKGAREQELDKVEYRGDAKQVAVIPKTTIRLMVFEFDGPDRINWQGQNCAMVRVKGSGAVAAASASAITEPAPPANAATAKTPANGAVLNLAAGVGGNPLPGHKFMVLRHSLDDSLAKAGFKSAQGTSAFKAWSTECQRQTAACRQGVAALQADGLGILHTDAEGKGKTPPLAAGTYYIFGSARQGDKPMYWNVRVDLKPGANSVTLDQRNASPAN